jgi:hypothetical protein
VAPVAPTGEQKEPPCATPRVEAVVAVADDVGGDDGGGGTVRGAVRGVVRGVVARGAVVGGVVGGGAVVGGAVWTVVVAGVVSGGFVGATADGDVVVVTVGTWTGLLLDVRPALAIATIRITTTTGTAIFAHSGHARTLSSADFLLGARGTVRITAVCSRGVTGTASVGAASSGAYHLPSEPSHQPGSSGC